MTEIVFFLDGQEQIQGFEVSGHTGFADRGEDIVCAGISILAQTAVIGLNRFLSKEPEVEIKDGYLRCRLPAGLAEAEMAKAQVILETTWLGFEATKESYKSYLIINKRRWG